MEALQERDTQQAGLLPFQFGVIRRLEPIRTHAASERSYFKRIKNRK